MNILIRYPQVKFPCLWMILNRWYLEKLLKKEITQISLQDIGY